MHTPVIPSITVYKWGTRGYISHGHAIDTDNLQRLPAVVLPEKSRLICKTKIR